MTFRELAIKCGQRILKDGKIILNAKTQRNKWVITAATIAMPTIMKSWPCDPHYIKYSKLIDRTKNLKNCAFRLYLWKSALQLVKYELYSSRDPTKDIKMHSHFIFLLASLKWPANLVNYYRPFRCDANHVQFISNNLVHSQTNSM